MLDKVKNRKQEGFTIIEVLIVLAIAGLIIAIVLIAVPNLQRSSRNTSIKNDANVAAGAVNEFVANNDGKTVTTLSGTAPNYELQGASGTSKTTFKVNGSTTVAVVAAPATAAAPGYDSAVTIPTNAKIALNQVAIVYGQDCTPTLNKRAVAIYYVLEADGNPVKCVTS